MRLSELFEDGEASKKEREFQDAWTAARPLLKAKGIDPSYYGKVQSRAHELAISYGMDVDDSISTAASEVAVKMKTGKTSKSAFNRTDRDTKRTPFSQRKRWANQYGSGGGQNRLQKAGAEIADLFNKEKAFGGELNQKSRRKR